MPRLRNLYALLGAAVLAAGVLASAAPALASHRQTMFFEAPGELLNPASRPGAISQLKHLGVHALRVQLQWSQVAPRPNAKHRPHFNARKPSSYAWGNYDGLLAEARRLHWKVLLTVTGPAPRWATQNKRAPYVMRPSRRDFGQFMTAIARHYRHEVALFAIWNEPNEFGYLRPQFNHRGNPVAGRIYRGLFEAGYDGLKAGGIRHPKVLMGETSPGGFARRTKNVPGYAGVAPLAFMRGALCMNDRYRKAKSCHRLPAYGYAQHPYASTTAGPFYAPRNPENVTIGTLGRLIGALNKAGRAHAVRRGMPIFLTEFGVMSKPNRYFGVSPIKQAEYDAIAERIAWEHGRVAAFSQYLLRDDPPSKSQGQVSFQTGLEYWNGRKKPLYRAFPVPLTVTRIGHRYKLWGLVRPTHKRTRVTILVQRGHSKRYRRLRRVRTDRRGYWTLATKVHARHWRVLWKARKGVRYEGPPIAAFPVPATHMFRGRAAARRHHRGRAHASRHRHHRHRSRRHGRRR